jgi:hypothetical protein
MTSLDAGWCEQIGDGDGAIRRVYPPTRAMFEQLVDYLDSKQPQDSRYVPLRIGEEAIAPRHRRLRARCCRRGPP